MSHVERASWDQYFVDIARAVATRGTCDRLRVGCVLVRDRSVFASGYNGAGAGLPHCDDPGVGHDVYDNHCLRAVHAEANAIARAARSGHATAGAAAYVTHAPCWGCFQLLLNAGITRIVCGEVYKPDARVTAAIRTLRLDARCLEGGWI
jgi:dCMP deaminase